LGDSAGLADGLILNRRINRGTMDLAIFSSFFFAGNRKSRRAGCQFAQTRQKPYMAACAYLKREGPAGRVGDMHSIISISPIKEIAFWRNWGHQAAIMLDMRRSLYIK